MTDMFRGLRLSRQNSEFRISWSRAGLGDGCGGASTSQLRCKRELPVLACSACGAMMGVRQAGCTPEDGKQIAPTYLSRLSPPTIHADI